MSDAIATLRSMRDNGAGYSVLRTYFVDRLQHGMCPHTYADAADIVAQAAQTTIEWVDLIDTIGEREAGNYVADWADESAYHAWLTEGVAYIATSDGGGIVTRWHDDGRVDTYSCESVEDAAGEVEDANKEWNQEEEEEEEDETSES